MHKFFDEKLRNWRKKTAKYNPQAPKICYKTYSHTTRTFIISLQPPKRHLTIKKLNNLEY